MMGIGGWKRARSPEQKAERERAILDAAAEVFLERGFDKASMRVIGCKARLSKGNLYRYFKTKEEVFLRLYQEDFLGWIDEVEQELRDRAGEGGIDGLARLVAASLVARPRMAGLISLLAAVLERNVEWEPLLEFKLGIVRRALGIGAAISAAVPELSEEQALLFVRMLHTHVAGLWPAANPSPAMQKAMAADETVGRFHLGFEEELAMSIRIILAGILEEPRHFPKLEA